MKWCSKECWSDFRDGSTVNSLRFGELAQERPCHSSQLEASECPEYSWLEDVENVK